MSECYENNLSLTGYDNILPSYDYLPNPCCLPRIRGGLRSNTRFAFGSIIPYASGLPIILTTVGSGLVGTVSALGFGSSATGLTVAGLTIDLTGTVAGGLINEAFSMPRDGVIRSISAYYSNVIALNLVGTTVNITAQLYSAPPTSNIFTAIPGASVQLAPISGVLALGGSTRGITTGLSIPVVAETRLLLVFSATTTGIPVATIITGYASAGVSIS